MVMLRMINPHLGMTTLGNENIKTVELIGEGTFYEDLKDVYYAGTKVQWENIRIEEYNDDLTNAAFHYRK